MPEHLVQFYESSALLGESTAWFLGPGLVSGDAVLVIATPAHRHDLRRRLFASSSSRSERYVALDAADTLSKFMVGNSPDAERFRHVLDSAVRKAGEGGSGRIRAFGEMVALLAADGRWQAALHLEELWNAAIAEHPLSLLCAYPNAVFSDEAGRIPFETICSQHSRVLPSEGRRPGFPRGRGHAERDAAARNSFVGLVERAIAAIRPLAEERGHILNVTWPEQDVHVEGDRARLVSVFASLLANAVRYTPARGRIRVSAAHEDQQAVLRIRDSGAGIVPGVLSPTLDPGGAITEVRDVVEMYGGVVEVRSSGLRQGVEFVVRLPVAGPPPQGESG